MCRQAAIQTSTETIAGNNSHSHEHANASARDDTCLFSFSDMPVIDSLGLYREEVCGENAGYQQ